MRCPSLNDLPPAPPGRTGWPWTEESLKLRDHGPQDAQWPRITVVTPSFNQGRFLEETIRSVLLQGYPDLEYLVLDGGSTDDSVEIIKKYSRWLRFWISEPDRGQSAAINRGLRMGSGVYATWINSDDLLGRNALSHHALNIGLHEDVVYIGDCIYIHENGQALYKHRGCVHSLLDLVRVGDIWRSGCIDQPAVLFPLKLALHVGGLNEDNHYTMDYELWGRFFLAGARVRYTGVSFGVFRRHGSQKTQDSLTQTESTLQVAAKLIEASDQISADEKGRLLAELTAYRHVYPALLWKDSGRLARMGLPPAVVTPVRRVKDAVQKKLGHMFGPMRTSK